MGLLRRLWYPNPEPGQVWETTGQLPFKVIAVTETSIRVVYANWVFEDGWDRIDRQYARSVAEWRTFLRQERRRLRK